MRYSFDVFFKNKITRIVAVLLTTILIGVIIFLIVLYVWSGKRQMITENDNPNIIDKVNNTNIIYVQTNGNESTNGQQVERKGISGHLKSLFHRLTGTVPPVVDSVVVPVVSPVVDSVVDSGGMGGSPVVDSVVGSGVPPIVESVVGSGVPHVVDSVYQLPMVPYIGSAGHGPEHQVYESVIQRFWGAITGFFNPVRIETENFEYNDYNTEYNMQIISVMITLLNKFGPQLLNYLTGPTDKSITYL